MELNQSVGLKSNNSSISPNLLIRHQQDFKQYLFGLYARKGVLTGGMWYRNMDAFILLVGVETGKFKMGYSYDATISRIAFATGGTHEISLSYGFNCRPKSKRIRRPDCPSF